MIPSRRLVDQSLRRERWNASDRHITIGAKTVSGFVRYYGANATSVLSSTDGRGAVLFFSLFLAFVAFIGSGAYAVLGIADYRAARRGFWATAISFATMGLLLGIMTTWPLPVRMVVCAAFFAVAGGGLIWVLEYLTVRERLGIADSQLTAPILDQRNGER